MPSYKYRVIFDDGKIGRGRILALNKNHAIESLKRENIQPIMVKKIKEKNKHYKRPDYARIRRSEKDAIKNAGGIGRKKKIDLKKLSLKDLSQVEFHPFAKVSNKDIIAFVNNFYILKKARFNNVQALQAVYDGTENPVFKDVIEDILIGVQSGKRLHATMLDYPKVFPPMFINFVRVGEESGTLDTALLYARDYVESSQQLTKKIKGAIIPRVLQFFGIMFAMLAAVVIGVPILEQVYSMFDSTQEIPAATMAMLAFAKWLIANWYIPVSIILGIAAIFFVWHSTPRGRYKWDKFLLTFPVMGPVINNITINKFFQAMLLNLKNGMRIQESLEISKNVTTNYYFLSAIEAGKANALAGSSWLTPFEEKKLFRPMVSQMVTIGMQTDLSVMMEKVNEYIKMEIDESIARFVKVLPDITYLFVGIALIAFVITVLVPVINVYMGGFIEVPS